MVESKENGLQASVVVPVKNRGALLRKCLTSLVSQHIDPNAFEVLVCDDGSAEDLTPIVEEFGPGPPSVRLLKQPASGPAAARNMGFRSSKAPIWICLDSDMTCDPSFVRVLLEVLEQRTEWVAAEGRVVLQGGNDSGLWDAPTNDGGVWLCGATAYRPEAMRLAGGFDETFTLPAGEDFELGIRLQELGTFGWCPEAISYHPRRRVSLKTFWAWRHFWRPVVIIALRYGYIGVPKYGKRTASPRLRTAFCATATLPGGRLLKAVKKIPTDPRAGMLGIGYALFDVLCGFCALPDVFLCKCPERKKYL